MSIQFIHRRRRSLSKLAWGLIPLTLIVATLLLFRQPDTGNTAAIEVVTTYPGAQLLAVNPTLRRDDADGQFVAPDSARRNRVLQRLGQFRADYRQAAPFLTISHSPGSPGRQQFAAEVAGALAQHDLGATGTAPNLTNDAIMDETGDGQADMRVRAARRDRNIVRELLWALSPYYSGRVLLVFDDSVRLDNLSLHIGGNPVFTREGVAVFQ